MRVKKFDFGAWATKNDLKCSDGRIIRAGAFKDDDGKKVPLFWQHGQKSAENLLGHAYLENRPEGVYSYGVFNDTPTAQHAKVAVQNGDITAVSIFANNLQEQAGNVLHGNIREVSLVIAGANPGAVIDNISFAHDDEWNEMEAVITTGESIILHSDEGEQEEAEEPAGDDAELEHALTEGVTLESAYNSMNEDQKAAMHAALAMVIQGAGEADDIAQHSAEGEEDNMKNKRNVFDQHGGPELQHSRPTISRETLRNIVAEAQKCGSFKEAFLAHIESDETLSSLYHAGDYGIDNIDFLFPDARVVNGNEPDFISRRMEWVSGVMAAVKRNPFSRIKSIHADITADEARAKGYITGNKKVEEVFPLLKRVTTPQTVYKKQKLDRDDIIDITDLDVVAWLKREMRMMLDEEIARAWLIGDGREVTDPDKINPENLRPIWTDDELYAVHVMLDADSTPANTVDAVVRARSQYKGSGNPIFYTTADTVTDLMLQKDTIGRRLYATEAELAAALRVSGIVEVEVMENQTRTVGSAERELVGIMVNLNDYVVGADRGGEVTMFDDFDIDFNQYKYLIEARLSSALVRPKSAVVIERPYTPPAAG